MRKLTTSELEAELQVGTVDLAEIELVLPLEQSIAEYIAAAEQMTIETLAVLSQDVRVETIDLKLSTQASKALQTRLPDTRAADAVADADLMAAISP